MSAYNAINLFAIGADVPNRQIVARHNFWGVLAQVQVVDPLRISKEEFAKLCDAAMARLISVGDGTGSFVSGEAD